MCMAKVYTNTLSILVFILWIYSSSVAVIVCISNCTLALSYIGNIGRLYTAPAVFVFVYLFCFVYIRNCKVHGSTNALKVNGSLFYRLSNFFYRNNMYFRSYLSLIIFYFRIRIMNVFYLALFSHGMLSLPIGNMSVFGIPLVWNLLPLYRNIGIFCVPFSFRNFPSMRIQHTFGALVLYNVVFLHWKNPRFRTFL